MQRPGMAPAYPKELLLSMYRKMFLIRRFEERAAQAYTQGKINGFCHLYIGQEAVAVGATEALRPDDYQIGAYRDHAYPLTRGADPGMVMAELFGRATGYCKGKGGSMHIADFGIGMLGANGIVAGGIAIVTGAGLAAQMEGKRGVAVSFFGDGASNAGPFHECLNIAATWKLPMLYVCENNMYAAQTAAAATHALSDVAARAAGYGIPGVVVDGNDIFAVYQAANRAVERARSGPSPSTFRPRPGRGDRAARGARYGRASGRSCTRSGSARRRRARARPRGWPPGRPRTRRCRRPRRPGCRSRRRAPRRRRARGSRPPRSAPPTCCSRRHRASAASRPPRC